MKYIIQSYVDLITNSSTSVFTWATSPEAVKEIINAVLKSAGSDLTCDDLFTIKVEYNLEVGDTDGWYVDEAKEEIEENPGKHPDLEELLKNYDDKVSKRLWSDASDVEEKIYHYMVNNCGSLGLDEFAKSHNESDPEWYYDSSYVIKSKDPSNIHNAAILNKINGLFDYDASYC